MSFNLSPEIVTATCHAAASDGFDPALLLAVVNTETGGQAVEPADGHTPTLLCEAHIFFRELPASKRAAAVKAGLARPKWTRDGYRDQGTSAGRMAKFARMVAFDEVAAYRSVSLGLMQIMGFHAQDCGYLHAKAMFDAFAAGGVEEMLRAGLRLLDKIGARKPLERHDWAAAAKAYNGSGYRKNAYDTKLANAYAHWHAALSSGQTQPPAAGCLGLGSEGDDVREVQGLLTQAGYPVRTDGKFGPKTQAAVAGFQVRHGMPGDGVVSPAVLAALHHADPAPQGARELATEKTLAKTSRIVQGGRLAKKAGWIGGVGGVVLEASPDGVMSAVNGAVDRVNTAKDTYGKVTELWTQACAHVPALADVPGWLIQHPRVLAWPALGAVVIFAGAKVIAARINDEQTGATV